MRGPRTHGNSDADRSSIEFVDEVAGFQIGEPVFAPRAGAADADDGWVIALVSDVARNETRVCVFDADGQRAGLIASVPLPLQAYGFHGAWEAAAAA